MLAVEVAENWQGNASFGLIDNPSVEVDGIGEEAHWQDIGGGMSQLVALGSGYFVALTVNGDQETAERLAKRWSLPSELGTDAFPCDGSPVG